jgi:hypothetical protein
MRSRGTLITFYFLGLGTVTMAPEIFIDSLSDEKLANFLQVATILLAPVGVLLALVLYKIISLLQHTLDFVNIAKFDVIPILQDVRLITAHTAKLSKQVDDGAQGIKSAVDKARPYVSNAGAYGKLGVHKLRTAFLDGASFLLKALSKEPSLPRTTVNQSTIVHGEGSDRVVDTLKTTVVENP